MLRYLKFLVCFVSAFAFAAPPVIWGPNNSIEALTGNGLLVGKSLRNDGNYIINSSAFVDTSNVTVSTATVSRSTTTPISTEKVAEFNVTITSANGTVSWATNALSEGLKSAQCEARWKYRGFQSTTLFQVKQGSYVVAQVLATVSTTGTSQGSLPFPCGDLSTSTTFVVTDTATLSGTNEISDIYVGQVQAFGDAANITPWVSYPCTVSPISGYSAAPTCFQRRVGDTLEGSLQFSKDGNAATGGTDLSVTLPSGLLIDTNKMTTSGSSQPAVGYFFCFKCFPRSTDYDRAGGMAFLTTSTLRFIKPETDSSMVGTDVNSNAQLAASFKVPIESWSSSNSAVSPSSQLLAGNIRWNGSINATSGNASFATLSSAGFNSPIIDGSSITTANNCGGNINDVGFCVSNLPANAYEISYDGPVRAVFGTATTTCQFRITDGTRNIDGSTVSSNSAASDDYINGPRGVLILPSFQSSLFIRLQAMRGGGATGTCTADISSSGVTPQFTIKPLRGAVSPIFIQGPVRSDGSSVPIPAGFIGEKLTVSNSNVTNFSATNTVSDFNSLTLTPGIWDLSYVFYVSPGGATITGAEAFIGTSPGNNTTGRILGENHTPMALNSTSTADNSVSLPSYRVFVSANTTYYLKGDATYSAGTPRYIYSYSAVRIR